MAGQILHIIQTLALCLASVTASSCLFCINDDKYFPPVFRHQLSTANDVFHRPLDALMDKCHQTQRLLPTGRYEHRQLRQCITDDDRCVTITPNVDGYNYTIRGCLTELLGYPLRQSEKLLKPTCFLAKSRPKYTNAKNRLSFMVCVCKGKNCNSGAQPNYWAVDIQQGVNAEEDLVELELVNENEVKAVRSAGESRTEAIYKRAGASVGSSVQVSTTNLASTILVLITAALLRS